MDTLKPHKIYRNLKCRLILDPLTSRRRFVPVEGQGLPTNLFIEAEKAIRNLHELNTVFIASEVKVCKKKGRDTFYLRAENQSLTPVSALKQDIYK